MDECGHYLLERRVDYECMECGMEFDVTPQIAMIHPNQKSVSASHRIAVKNGGTCECSTCQLTPRNEVDPRYKPGGEYDKMLEGFDKPYGEGDQECGK